MDSTDTVILGPDYPQARAEAQDFVAELAACVNGDEIELPSLPDVALKIRDALARDDADFERLAELAGSDPALAARLMNAAMAIAVSAAAVDAVRNHDCHPLDCGTPIALTDVVAVANYLSIQAEAGDEIDALIAQLPDFGALRLDEDALRFTLETANAEVDLLIAALEPGAKTQSKTVSSA